LKKFGLATLAFIKKMCCVYLRFEAGIVEQWTWKIENFWNRAII